MDRSETELIREGMYTEKEPRELQPLKEIEETVDFDAASARLTRKKCVYFGTDRRGRSGRERERERETLTLEVAPVVLLLGTAQ